MTCIKKGDIDILRYVSDDLKDNFNIVIEAIDKFTGEIKYASERLLNNKEIAMKVVMKRGIYIKYLPIKFRDD